MRASVAPAHFAFALARRRIRTAAQETNITEYSDEYGMHVTEYTVEYVHEWTLHPMDFHITLTRTYFKVDKAPAKQRPAAASANGGATRWLSQFEMHFGEREDRILF